MFSYLKNLVLWILFIVATLNFVCAQDTIYKKDGEKIPSKVIDPNGKDIQYKRLDDPEFSTFSIPKKEVRKISFEDGKDKVFKSKSTSYLSYSAGYCQPLGSYRNSDGDGGSFAGQGTISYLEAGFYFDKVVGLVMKVGNSKNVFKANKYESYFQRDLQPHEHFEVFFPEPNRSYRKWVTGFFMMGLVFTANGQKKINHDFKVFFGPSDTGSPEFGLRYLDDSTGATKEYILDRGGGKRFSFSPGYSMRMSVADKWQLKLGIDYFVTSPVIEQKWTVKVQDVVVNSNTRTSQYNISTLNVSFGVSYLFKKKNR